MDKREKYIRENLADHVKEAKTLGYEIFAVIVQGSQNYNLDIYTDEYKSDIDTKCIVLPTLDDIVRNKKPASHTHVRANNEHIDVKDIRLMFDCFKKQNINFVEVLFSDYYWVPDKYKEYWDRLRNMAEDIVHAHPAQTLRTMSGMSMEKYKALKHPYPTTIEKIEKYGYDPKQLHHIVRVNNFMHKYINGESFKNALSPFGESKNYLVNIKLGKLDLATAEKLAKEYDDETKEMKDTYIKQHGDEVNSAVYDALDGVKFDIIKKFLIECVRND